MQASDAKMWQASRVSGVMPACQCLGVLQNEKQGRRELSLHREVQDINCDAWQCLERLIEQAIARQSTEFAPGLEMPPEQWSQIVTLPESIGKLTSVRKFYLYGSHLVQIPPVIGNMTNLEELDLYTSYRLHWLPFELTRCRKLCSSRVSTRALYGNYKYRSPFPKLEVSESHVGRRSDFCSVCGGLVASDVWRQVWISLRIGTDVLPLLVNACSDNCVRRLPTPARGYVDHPHRGGMDLVQPETGLRSIQ